MSCPYCNQNKWKQATCQGCGYQAPAQTEMTRAYANAMFGIRYGASTQTMRNLMSPQSTEAHAQSMLQQALASPSIAQAVAYARAQFGSKG